MKLIGVFIGTSAFGPAIVIGGCLPCVVCKARYFFVGDIVLFLRCLQHFGLHFEHFQFFCGFNFVHLQIGECLKARNSSQFVYLWFTMCFITSHSLAEPHLVWNRHKPKFSYPFQLQIHCIYCCWHFFRVCNSISANQSSSGSSFRCELWKKSTKCSIQHKPATTFMCVVLDWLTRYNCCAENEWIWQFAQYRKPCQQFEFSPIEKSNKYAFCLLCVIHPSCQSIVSIF